MGKPKLKCLQNQAITDRVGCAAINAVGKTVLLTTPASSEPCISGLTVCGVHPVSPILYRVPCTG